MATLGFLNDDDLIRLTGRKLKSRQIVWLKAEGIPFRVNATGHPVVTWAAVEGRKDAEPQPQGWTPRVIAGGA
jgi:hypothetical protein